MGQRKFYVHRLVVHAKTGFSLDARTWQTEHLAGTELYEADLGAGWCLGTWDGLTLQEWDADVEDWEPTPGELRTSARQQLARYRRGSMWA